MSTCFVFKHLEGVKLVVETAVYFKHYNLESYRFTIEFKVPEDQNA